MYVGKGIKYFSNIGVAEFLVEAAEMKVGEDVYKRQVYPINQWTRAMIMVMGNMKHWLLLSLVWHYWG